MVFFIIVGNFHNTFFVKYDLFVCYPSHSNRSLREKFYIIFSWAYASPAPAPAPAPVPAPLVGER